MSKPWRSGRLVAHFKKVGLFKTRLKANGNQGVVFAGGMAQHSELFLGVPTYSTSEVPQVLKDIADKEAKFTAHHHDGSKLDNLV
ncbi:hypothetical protein CEP52_015120 [Fusarium oligoseptatum]|uniref:Uncharacterized protein n=1 Tax=Fusarium oligoseptatum TaxID=2604345 RepID=A0A428SG01_9HYPO|nr:hypothetical protein CEP52_015120 [Fusarium oligoseptatum]